MAMAARPATAEDAVVTRRGRAKTRLSIIRDASR
jgi:hypothetical protein